MSCKILILVMMIPNGEWTFSDVLTMQKLSRKCERENKCLKRIEKHKNSLKYQCKIKEPK